jgi:hypothetical protein
MSHLLRPNSAVIIGRKQEEQKKSSYEICIKKIGLHEMERSEGHEVCLSTFPSCVYNVQKYSAKEREGRSGVVVDGRLRSTREVIDCIKGHFRT